MPIYDFACKQGHVTEVRAGVDTGSIPCPCGRIAKRMFSVPAIKVEGGVSIPAAEGFYRNEAMGKRLKRDGWSVDRVVENVRRHRVETDDGFMVDMRKANACD